MKKYILLLALFLSTFGVSNAAILAPSTPVETTSIDVPKEKEKEKIKKTYPKYFKIEKENTAKKGVLTVKTYLFIGLFSLFAIIGLIILVLGGNFVAAFFAVLFFIAASIFLLIALVMLVYDIVKNKKNSKNKQQSESKKARAVNPSNF